jgi:hypothetical protein
LGLCPSVQSGALGFGLGFFFPSIWCTRARTVLLSGCGVPCWRCLPGGLALLHPSSSPCCFGWNILAIGSFSPNYITRQPQWAPSKLQIPPLPPIALHNDLWWDICTIL